MLKSSPTLSIITATFNSAATIGHCLESVNSQTFPAEQIIIDGASTDNTLEVVQEYSPNARIISEPDSGIYDAMNKGIALAAGNVIGILNSDDFYSDNFVLERVARVFEDPAVDACYGDLAYVKETFLACKKPRARFANFKVVRYWKSGQYTSRSFYWGWMPPHPTFFVRKSVYDRFGLFDQSLGTAADYELMLRLMLKHKISTQYIPNVLVRMRIGGKSNISLMARLKANRMDNKAWEINGLKKYPWTLIFKPCRKISQWLVK